jgi:hypothetical protein
MNTLADDSDDRAPAAIGISSILINIKLGYLAVKHPPRITTYLKQVSTSVGLRRNHQIEGIVSE